MRLILAYIAVLAVGHFAVSAGVIVAVPFSFLMLFLPDNIRVSICGFIGGAAGTLLAVTIAYFIFKWLVGDGSFGVLPFIASVIPLAITMSNDVGFYRNIRRARLDMLSNVQGDAAIAIAKLSEPDVITRKAALIGNLCGIPIAAYWFLLR